MFLYSILRKNTSCETSFILTKLCVHQNKQPKRNAYKRKIAHKKYCFFSNISIFTEVRNSFKFMLKEERHQYILTRLNENSRIYITSLSTELKVSDDTLRRDLTELDQQGLLTKVYGGAIAKSGISFEFTDRLNTDMAIKHNLASKVVPLFNNNDVLLMDGGTSNLEVARQLNPNISLTIYTNSFPIANELMQKPQVELIFIGGKIFPPSQVSVGVMVFQTLQTIRPDWLVLGISNIHPQQGLTCPDREEAFVKRMMIERARKRITIADSSKLNTAEVYNVGSLGDIDYLVTEDDKIEMIKRSWVNLPKNVI